jgi:hypothetical protein
VSALAVIHNFIGIHDPRDYDFKEKKKKKDKNKKKKKDKDKNDQDTIQMEERVVPSAPEERRRATRRRDQITQAMWRDFKP